MNKIEFISQKEKELKECWFEHHEDGYWKDKFGLRLDDVVVITATEKQWTVISRLISKIQSKIINGMIMKSYIRKYKLVLRDDDIAYFGAHFVK